MRLIDADEVLKSLDNLCKNCENNDGILCEDCDLADAIRYVKDAPTIDAQPGWIKCGEKLPDTGVAVLVCVDDDQIYVGCLTYYKMFAIDDIYCDIDIDNIKAWMPLPEPPEVTQ